MRKVDGGGNSKIVILLVVNLFLIVSSVAGAILYEKHQNNRRQLIQQQQAADRQHIQQELNSCIGSARMQAEGEEYGAGAVIVYNIQREEELAIQACQSEYKVPN